MLNRASGLLVESLEEVAASYGKHVATHPIKVTLFTIIMMIINHLSKVLYLWLPFWFPFQFDSEILLQNQCFCRPGCSWLHPYHWSCQPWSPQVDSIVFIFANVFLFMFSQENKSVKLGPNFFDPFGAIASINITN